MYLNGCAFAAIGIDYRAGAQGTFIKCYIGGAPYGIYKECNGQTTYSDNLVSFANSTWVQCTTEYIGNGFISDESEAGGGNPVSYWYNCNFEMNNFNWEPANNLASKAKAAVVGMGKGERISFLGFKETFGWTPGSKGTFNIGRAPGFFIEGDVRGLVTRAKNDGKHLFAANSDQSVNRIQFHHVGPTWDGWGHGRKCTTGQSWIAGDVVMDSTNTVSIGTPANLGYVNAFAGVALEDNDGTANNICLIVEQGLNVTVNADVQTLPTVGYGDLVKMSATSGKVGGAINVADGIILGYAHATANGTGGANGTYSIRIFNPPIMTTRPVSVPIRTESGTSVTVSNLALREGYVRFTNASAVTYTIPTNATTPLPVGINIRLFAAGAGGVTVSPASGVTLNGTATIAQNTAKTLIQVSTDVWDIY